MRNPCVFSPLGNGGGPTIDRGSPKIQAIETNKIGALGSGSRALESNWTRQPDPASPGATHCKSFHCKLSNESMDFLDSQINEWLDNHPEYVVKFVTTSVGEWVGKTSREPQMIVQLWL